MEYTFLGNSGLQVSRIGFGNMINYKLEDDPLNFKIIQALYDAGVNFFDTAENYAWGEAESALGRAIKALKLPREKLVISTKFFNCPFAGGNPINRTVNLSRKHIIDGMNASLQRLQLDYVDIAFVHIYTDTPIQEICSGFNQIIEEGKAFYWGTSNYNAQSIEDINNYCDQHGLIKPIAEQCQYNMVNRNTLEYDLVPLIRKGLGTTTYSPLGGGLLTGKYNDAQHHENTRSTTDYNWFPKELAQMFFFNPYLSQKSIVQSLNELGQLAKELGYSQAQLALAWVLRNKDVSTAIIGARSVEQVQDTLKALELYKKWDDALENKVEVILNNPPKADLDFRKVAPVQNRRKLK